LQEDLATNHSGENVILLAVNEHGYGPPDQQSAVELATEDIDLPLLQDTEEQDVWTTGWAVTYRDVIIVDANGVYVEVFNLTSNNLGDTSLTQDIDGDGTLDATNYAFLKARLLAAGGS
jgi:hypothetical protein